MMPELKPCPKCGGKARFDARIACMRPKGQIWFFVRCERCKARTGLHKSLLDAIVEWTRRENEHQRISAACAAHERWQPDR